MTGGERRTVGGGQSGTLQGRYGKDLSKTFLPWSQYSSFVTLLFCDKIAKFSTAPHMVQGMSQAPSAACILCKVC
jgi:hypothetical protein